MFGAGRYALAAGDGVDAVADRFYMDVPFAALAVVAVAAGIDGPAGEVENAAGLLVVHRL